MLHHTRTTRRQHWTATRDGTTLYLTHACGARAAIYPMPAGGFVAWFPNGRFFPAATRREAIAIIGRRAIDIHHWGA